MTEPIAFRRLTRQDFPLLGSWLERTHVARWWADDPSVAALEAEYGASIDGAEAFEVFIAVLGSREIGLIQRYRIDLEPEYLEELRPIVQVPDGAMSIDYLIGEIGDTGRGVGTVMIGAFVDRLWADHPDCPCIIVPVHAENRPSWRALERCGFVRVAEGELTPDNPIDSRDHVISRLDRPSP